MALFKDFLCGFRVVLCLQNHLNKFVGPQSEVCVRLIHFVHLRMDGDLSSVLDLVERPVVPGHRFEKVLDFTSLDKEFVDAVNLMHSGSLRQGAHDVLEAVVVKNEEVAGVISVPSGHTLVAIPFSQNPPKFRA
jgi:hypothetical protein